MTNNDELAMQAEQCANILENISGFEPDDIDGDAVDLRFDLDGMDTGCTVSLVEQCQHASDALRALLAERDADKKRIAELNRDVDAANARVDTKCAQLCNQDEEIEMLRLRIAELEARTASVKLPDDEDGQPFGFGKWANSKLPATTGAMTISRCEDSWRAALYVFATAAGIKLEVGE